MSQQSRRWSIFGATLLLLSTTLAGAEPFDLVIRGGNVIDGTGAPGYRADVGMRDGQIAAVGDLRDAEARDAIDASGLIVAPGFIDVHNHVPDKLPAIQGPLLNEGFVTQGVTTIVGGPDGALSPAGMLAAIERLERDGIATNYAFYVGHNGIRREVMGNARRLATETEIERMQVLVRAGMELGAVGFSTGLMYEPGMFSNAAEVIELARQVRSFGGTYDTHTRDPVFDMMGSNREAIEVGRQARIPVKIGHIKPVGLHNRGRSVDEIGIIEAARASGLDVVADQYPYDGAASRTLEAIFVVPGVESRRAGPDRETLRSALADPARRQALKQATEQGIDGGFSWVKAVGYGSLRIVDAPDDPQLVGKNIESFAAERALVPFDLLAELMLEHPRPILVTLGALEESDLRAELAMPWVMICSDGGYLDPNATGPIHPRYTGSFTRVLGHYVRDVKLFSLAEAVRKMTSLPADHLHLADRGRIRTGNVADITVFDAARVRDRSTWTDPAALSEGIRHVVVNGVKVLGDGRMTGATPGRLVKRQVPAKRSEPSP